MPKSYACSKAILDYLFNANEWSELGASFYLALHSTVPIASSAVGEIGYFGYARQELPRSGFSFDSLGSTVFLPSDIQFPEVTSPTGQYAIGWSINTALTGGKMVYYGSLGTSIPIQLGVVPTIKTGSFITES